MSRPLNDLAVWSAIFLTYSTFAMSILLILIFPAYVIVYRANREREKELPVYPIIRNFYQTVCLFYVMVLINLIYFISMIIIDGEFDPLNWVHSYPIFIALTILAVYMQAHNFIIAALSLQRFTLFFFRSYEQFLKEKSGGLFLFIIYSIFFLSHAGIFLWYNDEIRKYQKLTEAPAKVYLVFYITVNLVLLISGSLYIPIVLKVKKLANLSVKTHYDTQKHILYQALSIVLFKASHSWGVFVIQFESLPLYNYLYVFLIMDMISTPGLIQVSYLLCNKQNMTILNERIGIVKRSLLVAALRSSRVQSVQNAHMATSGL